MLERIRTAVRDNPRQLTLVLAKQLGVAELEIIRCMPRNQIVELDLLRWEELIRAFEGFAKIHVICSNGAVTLEAFGQFGNFSTHGQFFNVQTASLDMHIRFGQLGAVFAVEKPGHMDGVNTLSFQFFDKDGHSAFKVFVNFGGAVAPPERIELFNSLREKMKLG